MIRQALATLAAAAGLLFAVWCAGAVTGVFWIGFCMVAGARACL